MQISRQFITFVVTGLIAALVNFSSRFLFSELVSFRLAVIYAYLVGMLTAYLLSRIFVFEKTGRHPASELFWFSLVNLFAILQVWVISVGLAEYIFPYIGFDFYPEATAHFIGLSVPVITSYLGHKHLSFKKFVQKDITS